ncbi:hypothetical protein NE237_021969 [Protea cynaroides]|uniref:Uncharacterized protein n=1 Tax=Protea cynaroides TaxID=273540 RepID=A0A9Q0K336_9MAGN|nr:hypothetical protein NE237_021969 [Protea cynaroides]
MVAFSLSGLAKALHKPDRKFKVLFKQVVNSGANLYVCYGCLSIINKFVYFSRSDMILALVKNTNISSFLADSEAAPVSYWSTLPNSCLNGSAIADKCCTWDGLKSSKWSKFRFCPRTSNKSRSMCCNLVEIFPCKN